MGQLVISTGSFQAIVGGHEEVLGTVEAEIPGVCLVVVSLTMMMIIGGMTLGNEVAEREEEEVIGSLVVIGALAGLHLEEAETDLAVHVSVVDAVVTEHLNALTKGTIRSVGCVIILPAG